MLWAKLHVTVPFLFHRYVFEWRYIVTMVSSKEFEHRTLRLWVTLHCNGVFQGADY